VKGFVQEDDGPTAVEYAVMLALIIVVCLSAIAIVECRLARFQPSRSRPLRGAKLWRLNAPVTGCGPGGRNPGLPVIPIDVVVRALSAEPAARLQGLFERAAFADAKLHTVVDVRES
jgi:Flp pilus assembly pilin Flp